MFWNHRVFEKTDFSGEKYFEIHEVYYNDDHTIHAMTSHAVSPIGISLDDLQKGLEYMLKSLKDPILKEEEINFIDYCENDYDDEIF